MKIICPACGEENNKDFNFYINQGNRGKVNWQICANCKAYFSTSEYDKSIEQEYTFESTSYGPEKSGIALNKFKERMYNAIASIIENQHPAPATLLDIGCSYGGFLRKMKDKGYNVEGYDILPKAVNFVVNSLNINAIVCFSMSEFSSKTSKYFDIITVLDCNYYWSNQLIELKEIFSKLNSNGILVMRITDKSKYLVIGRFVKYFSNKLGQKIIKYSVNDHRFSMPLNSMLKLLKSVGFKIEYISSYNAIYSTQTHWFVKFLFLFGSFIRILTGINYAPGLVIIGRKSN